MEKYLRVGMELPPSPRRGGVTGSVAGFLINLALLTIPVVRADEVEVTTRPVRGTIRFTNVNPAIVDLLGPPGNEGFSSLGFRADSLAPREGIVAYANPPAPGKLIGTYEILLQAGPGEGSAVAYSLQPYTYLDSDREQYNFLARATPALVAGPEPVSMDFGECVGLLTLRFVDFAGAPVQVDALSGNASSAVAYSALYSVPAGSTQARFVVPSGPEFTLSVQAQRGRSIYDDQITDSFIVATNVPCDTTLTLDLALREPADLARITGTVDMKGEFEWTSEGVPATGLRGRTAVFSIGPADNRRWDFVAGDNEQKPASGRFELENLLPSDAVAPPQGWRVWTEMHFRAHRRFEYFVSPQLGVGTNNAVAMAFAGAATDLGDTFVFAPGTVAGAIVLAGPPDTAATRSALRGVQRPDDQLGEDSHGIPNFTGSAGINQSHVSATGADRLAPGATLTAAGGSASVAFPGGFSPATGSFEGDYELVVGGLKGEPGIWQRDLFRLSLYTPDGDGVPYVNQGLTITEKSAVELVVGRGQRVIQDVRYGFSEVCVRISSAGRKFYSPRIATSVGSFDGPDFEGHHRRYEVYLDGSYALPSAREDAVTSAVVTLYLPEGVYDLQPAVTVLNDDGTESATGLNPIRITVGARQRICVESCLQVEATVSRCTAEGMARILGRVRTCGQPVRRISYQLNGGAEVTICENCGPAPIYGLDVTLPPGNADTNVIRVIARDEQGAESFLSATTARDAGPPVLRCPADLVVPRSSPCGALVYFNPTAADACGRDVDGMTPESAPSSGSFFPIGETVVQTGATDRFGNRSQCSFKVTVTAGGEFPDPTVSDVLPRTFAGAGDLISIRGTKFTSDDEVLLDGQPLASPVFVGDSEILGIAPALADGPHEVQVLRCGRIVARLANGCASGPLPRLIAVEPRESFARGGNLVTVRGNRFTASTRIRIAFPAEGDANLLRDIVVSADGSSLTGILPPLAEGELLGARDVIAFDGRGEDLLPGGVSYLPGRAESDPQVISLRRLQAASAVPVAATWRNGFPGGLSARVKAGGGTPEERARSFVRGFKELLRVREPDVELGLAAVTRNDLDDVRLFQRYADVPVLGGEIVVTLAGDEVVALTGSLLSSEDLVARRFDPQPKLTPAEAVEIARLDQGVQRPVGELDPETSLAIYDLRLYTDAPLDPHLVWKVKIAFADHEVLVDAHTGAVVARFAVHQEHRFDLDIQDAEREANAKDDHCFNTSDDTDVADEDDFNSDYNNDLDAVLANRFARDCWHYFHHHFGWKSYDNDDAQLEIFIHTTIDPATVASWTRGCDTMQFADGGVDYEVMVHEFTHAIVASTSRLVYQFQSGALDEHFADTMAVIADRERGEIENPGQPINWMIAENRRPPQPTRAIRNFLDPATGPGGSTQPDRMANYCCNTATPNMGNDFGGVHSNSGIPNKAAYLMIEGGSFQGFLVRGLGADKVRHIKFASLRNLPSNATFADARAREIAAVEDWARRGDRGFRRDDICTVRNAWAAVGVGLGDSNCDGIEDTFNDVDGDFIPTRIDNCPNRANPRQENADGDLLGNVCDNCPFVRNDGQEDHDSDGIGDPCDPDRDGDGCRNEVDQHPESNQHRVGTAINVLCPNRQTAFFDSEAGDTDGDRLLDCEDRDDDNDGVPDDRDDCPVGKLPGNIGGGCTLIGESCPVTPKDWFLACVGGGCVQYFVRVTDRTNPDPTRSLILDRVQIVNQVLYVAPNIGVSLADVSKAISGRLRLGVAAGGLALAGVQPAPLRRFELWRRGTTTEAPRLVSVVGDFDPAALDTGENQIGAFLALTPQQGATPPHLDAVWQMGDRPGSLNVDRDGDQLPDGWEIQHGLNPADSGDATNDLDADGQSNLAEFKAGSNPQLGTSRFAIDRIEHRAGKVEISVTAPPGRRCQLERTASLKDPAWLPAGAPVLLHGDTVLLTDDTAAGQAFYRVRFVEP